MRETYKKVVESSNKCFICSSIPTGKNKVNIFRKKSTDLAGIIRSSMEFDVERNTTKTVICLFADSVFSRAKYERAAKKLREIKQELLTAS